MHGEAERLEHAVSDSFTERLAELLGHPERDPHGDPIPGADGTIARPSCSAWPA
ncbi:metal-dependent transcriptional regulator [Rubrobacter tropicus]|uniref:metal-dependent transcriptional regulator n=1 Tax=Rubrobacter tropicus TaxID=2653851 RepID=UPI00389A6B21